MTESTRLLMAFYGDDFTGSTDAMESLAIAGLRTVLFLKLPSPAALARFEGVGAIGVAGMTRAMTREAMDAHLPEALRFLAALRAPVLHYKVCSTFDSAPQVGSIGKAIDIAWDLLEPAFVPVAIGVPPLGRYCLFGNLFARAGSDPTVYRLDRHPTMSRHPVTPMDESDLAGHLGKQTAKRTALLDLLQLRQGDAAVDRRVDELVAAGAQVIVLDTLEPADLLQVGRCIWTHGSPERPLFVVGSSGVGYALARYWKHMRLVSGEATFAPPGKVAQIAAVSGSCSPVTALQIDSALQSGFADLALDPGQLVEERSRAAEVDRVCGAAVRLARTGQSIIVHSSRGPDDPRIPSTEAAFARAGYYGIEGQLRRAEILGQALGRVLAAVLRESPIRRLVVAGGDTSSFVARTLDIDAVEATSPIAPGAPLCRVHSLGGPADGTEILFKGGQLGGERLFERARDGVSYLSPGRTA